MTPRDLVQSPGWKVMPWIERCEVGKKEESVWGDRGYVQLKIQHVNCVLPVKCQSKSTARFTDLEFKTAMCNNA